MTCFCDIPFDLSNSHRNIYRNFGLTMTESWKLKNLLNPISYLQFNSKLSNLYCKIINIFQSILESSSNKNEIRELANLLRHQSYFLKQYKNDKGFIDYAGKIRKLQKSKFYDEREWRYIPFDAQKVDELFLSIKDFDNEQLLKSANERLIKYKLNFTSEDISYLIVENKEQKNIIKKMYQTLYDSNVKVRIIRN